MQTDTNIKLLALDLDGTVLTSDKQVTPRTEKALAAATEAGVEIVYVTGRPFHGLPAELMKHSFSRYVITSNGAVTYDLANNTTLRSALIRPDITGAIIEQLENSRLLYNVFINGMGYCREDDLNELLRQYTGTPIEHYVRQSRRAVSDISRLHRLSESGAENIWIRCRDSEERDLINEKIRKESSLLTVLTSPTDIETGASEADKGMALRDLSVFLNIEKTQILSIGDNENDLGMFRASGKSVAMGNASPAVRAQASEYTLTNNQDGAAEVIERYCL